MADRGEYRAIRTVLLDGPDFQSLSAEARWVFVALKLNLGPSGIDVFYDAGALEAQTGYTRLQLDLAIGELVRGGWIRRERNVWWIVDGIEHEPSWSCDDGKHRMGLWKHLDGLPRLAIVQEFIDRNPRWFTPVEAKEGLRTPSQGPTKALPSTEDGRRKTDTEDGKRKTETDAREQAPVAPALDPAPRAGARTPQPPASADYSVEEHDLRFADLPQGARDFIGTFYARGKATRERRKDVADQLLRTMNGGAPLRRGVAVQAKSKERLERKCREVIADGVRNPDGAIVVLLKKLADVSDMGPNGEGPGAQLRVEAAREEQAEAETDAAVRGWRRLHAEEAQRIAADVLAEFDVGSLSELTDFKRIAAEARIRSEIVTAMR
ncbi:MAG: hypothetical protein HOQ26_08020, partial [Gemmatimonadaceae bacterium]|nr:hypothetical protein [Gemmatimonadaceae bacterium]NUQ92845.1 hypothetical protein [Gemmatimonadaceae bacterium]